MYNSEVTLDISIHKKSATMQINVHKSISKYYSNHSQILLATWYRLKDFRENSQILISSQTFLSKN